LEKNIKKHIPMPRSRFLRVRCSSCGNEQVIFGSPASLVKCVVCENTLAVPRSGKGQVSTTIVEVLE
jgi:small subunit ribosomal protein S27e